MNSQRIRLGIDARILSQPMSGVGRYTMALLDALKERDLFDVTLFTDTPILEEHCPHIHHFPVKTLDDPTKRRQWKNWILPKQLKEAQIDIYHATWDKGIPIFPPCQTVMTIHDLYYISDQNNYLSFDKKKKRQIDLMLETRSCQKVFTDSESIKTDVKQLLNVPDEKIVVTYLDCDRQALQQAVNTDMQSKEFEQLINDGNYFISVVGRLNDKRKNIPFLLKSFSKFIYRNQEKRGHYKLVLVGSYSSDEKTYLELKNYVNQFGLEKNVVFTGYVSDAELCQLMKAAQAMILTSFLEGFGIPILEAFYLKVPVIAGNSCAMGEVAAGGCAILVDPTKEERLADAMAKIILDEQFAKGLVNKGSARLEDFSWKKTMDKIIQTYLDLAVVNKESYSNA